MDKNLIQFNKIMYRISFREREVYIRRLDECLIPEKPGDEPLLNRRWRLKHDIYESIKGKPRTWPQYDCLIKKEDVENREFEEQIGYGIQAYLKAPEKKRLALKKSWLNKWKPCNVISRLFPKKQYDF